MPAQVSRLFRGSRVVGKRFPVALVYAEGVTHEVTSFYTGVAPTEVPADAASMFPVSPRNQIATLVVLNALLGG